MAVSSGMLDRVSVDVSTNKTLAAADSGIVQNVTADAITITLPATAANLTFIVRNGGVKKTNGPAGSGDDASCLVTIAPNASDGITGNGFSAATNKTALNTKATARVGDEIVLIGTGTTGATGWIIQRVSGTWVRGA